MGKKCSKQIKIIVEIYREKRVINNLNENLLNRNYSLTWFEEKYIDLLEMSPREDSFQDLIVYPLIDSILANKIMNEYDIVDSKNFRQFNTIEHDRRKYSVLTKAVPDMLIAKDFFYKNRNPKIQELLQVRLTFEIKEPNSNEMLNGSLKGDCGKYYKNSLYLEIVPSLWKNGRSILTNLRRWHFFDIAGMKDKKYDELRNEIKEYILIQELCGFDNIDECYNKNAGKKGNPSYVPTAEALNNHRDQLYNAIIKNREMHEMIHNALDSDVSINAFRNIQKDADNYYFESIREFLCESESCDPIDLVRNEGKMVVDRVGNLDDNNSKVITDISDLDVNVADWNMLISYIDSEINTVQDMQPLDYILSVDVFSEGVDIVEVNQVIMLRPTQSPIVFIQQLGRGLRKAEGKEYVVVLDFIGNYTNNFMIPIALSGDRSYNQDTIRKYVISGNNTILGASTIHFDRIAKEKIFNSIDKIKGIKSIIRESYISLKNRLGKVPYLIDFYENGEVDPLVIIREYKTYQNFLLSVESEQYCNKISSQELVTLEYLSKTILSGARPYELEILKKFLNQDVVYVDKINNEFKEKYGYEMDTASFESAINVLQGHFVSKDDEYKKYCHIDIVNYNKEHMILRMKNFSERLQHMEFYKQVNDIIEVGLKRYKDKYSLCQADERPFVLYEKYSRRDISLLMNCEKDFSSTMYGMKRIKDDVFIFVTYHKQQNIDDEKNYVDGKPDYADVFENNMIFRWDSQIGRGINSSYVSDVTNSARKHLLVKKCDAETGFYYMGQFDVIGIQSAKKKDNKGKEREITKFQMRMHHAVREDILKYLQSSILLKNN